MFNKKKVIRKKFIICQTLLNPFLKVEAFFFLGHLKKMKLMNFTYLCWCNSKETAMLVYYQARLGPIPPAYTQAPGSSQALSSSLASTLGSSPPDLQNSFSWAFFFFWSCSFESWSATNDFWIMGARFILTHACKMKFYLPVLIYPLIILFF